MASLFEIWEDLNRGSRSKGEITSETDIDERGKMLVKELEMVGIDYEELIEFVDEKTTSVIHTFAMAQIRGIYPATSLEDLLVQIIKTVMSSSIHLGVMYGREIIREEDEANDRRA